MTPVQPQRRWHEQPASLAALALSTAVALCGAISAVVVMAVANETRQSAQDRQIALSEQRLGVLEKTLEAHIERQQMREAENRAAQQQEMAMLTSIQQQLAVHEARGGLGIQFRQPLSKGGDK